MGASQTKLYVFALTESAPSQTGLLGVMDKFSKDVLASGQISVLWSKTFNSLPKITLMQTVFGNDQNQIAFAGSVNSYRWQDASLKVHYSQTGRSYVPDRGIMYALHSICPVFPIKESQGNKASTFTGGSSKQVDLTEQTWPSNTYPMSSISVFFIKQETHYGAIRLYNVHKFSSS